MEDIVAHRVAALPDSQRRMLRLASGGATVAEIAIRLALPARVVGRELSAVRAALGVSDTQQATLLWWGSRAGANPHMIDAAQDLMS